MKNKILILSISMCVLCGAQDFVNLTLDNPDLTGSLRPVDSINPRTSYIGETSRLLPGWTVLSDGAPLNEVQFLAGDGDITGQVLLQSNSVLGAQGYRLSLWTGLPYRNEIILRQSGTVPVDASSLTFSRTGVVGLYVNNESVYQSDPSGTFVPTVDLSRFSGQLVKLEFRFPAARFDAGQLFLDIRGFSQVPEPSGFALMGIGGCILIFVNKLSRWNRS
jgi:hypothetical protein